MAKLTLEKLQAEASMLGVVVEEDHVESIDGTLPGYWMLDAETGDGVWEDENFSTSLEEVAGKLIALEIQREPNATA